MLVNHFKSEWYRYVLQTLVVVVGIVVAFALNNIKDSRRLDKEESQNYSDILLELRKDLDEIQGNKSYNQRYMKRYEIARKIILTDKKMQKADTLAKIATELLSFSDFKKKTSIYEVLAASGKLDLISNKNILYQLQNLEIQYMYINRLESNQQDLIFLILPQILEYVRMNPFQVKHPKALYSYRFHNVIELYLRVVEEKDLLYDQTEKELQLLIKSLEKELS